MPPVDLRTVCLVQNLGGRAGTSACLEGPGGNSQVVAGAYDGVPAVVGAGLSPGVRML